MKYLTLHPSSSILDSTKLDDYLRCPRRFFYSYVLGWQLDIPAHDLYFGECWHKAREYQLIYGYDKIDEAFNVFLTHYRKKFPESTDHIYPAKNPQGVYQALIDFAVTYNTDQEKYILLKNNQTNEPFTEISGTVPVDDSRFLYFRMDSLMMRKEDEKIFSFDHKTTSASYIQSPTWSTQFTLSIQTGTYTHCMYCLFPPESVLGVVYCGIGFGYNSRTKTYNNKLQRVEVFPSYKQMYNWLWYTLETIYDIERDFDRLSDCSPSDSIMQAFRLNPSGCTKYRGCEYYDLCINLQNPLTHADTPPYGFTQRFWDPRELDTRNKLNLEWTGD